MAFIILRVCTLKSLTLAFSYSSKRKVRVRFKSFGVLLLGSAFRIESTRGGIPADLRRILLTSVVLISFRDS